MDPISYSCVNEESHKGEDFWVTQTQGRVCGFGVFDGHGGKDCARFCASKGPEGILPRLLMKSTLPTPTEVEDAFWKVDAECGPALAARGGHGRQGGGAHAGTTSNVLFIEALPARSSKAGPASAAGLGSLGGYRCLWAWTGDSTGITVDMSSGKLGPCTTNHVPESEVEAANLRMMEAVGKLLLKGKGKDDKKDRKDRRSKLKGGESGEGGEVLTAAATSAAAVASVPTAEAEAPAAASSSSAEHECAPNAPLAVAPPTSHLAEDDCDDSGDEALPTLDDVVNAMQRAGVQPTPTCDAALMLRALERERLIARTIPKGRKYRRNAVMQRRPRAKDENMPMVVDTHEDPYSSHYRDLLMTRSVCDWTKSCWVLPHPETLEFTVAHSKRFRVVLASDGLWDICSAERAAEVAFRAPTVHAAAVELLNIARGVYHGERGLEKMGDDTTILVLELNPSGSTSAAAPALKRNGSGCSIS